MVNEQIVSNELQARAIAKKLEVLRNHRMKALGEEKKRKKEEEKLLEAPLVSKPRLN